MPVAMDRIFEAITDYSKTMGSLHGDFMSIVKRDIERFMEMTNDLQSQMQWQAGTVFALTSISASLAVVGSLMPKGAGAAASTTLNDPRLGANDGIGDAISNALKFIGDKLKDSEFLRTSCKTTGKFFDGLSKPVELLFQSRSTQLDAKRELMKMSFQEGQQEKSAFDQEIRRAQDSALSILQSKAKSG